jgi:hypothetical protein
MKLLGGVWSKADVFALTGVIVAIVAIFIAHRDAAPTDEKKQDMTRPLDVAGAESKTQLLVPENEVIQPGTHVANVSSGEIKFNCLGLAHATTPKVFLGPTARDVIPTTGWVSTINDKEKSQQVFYDHTIDGKIEAVYAEGEITGLDMGWHWWGCHGGHGALALHVTWTEDPATQMR